MNKIPPNIAVEIQRSAALKRRYPDIDNPIKAIAFAVEKTSGDEAKTFLTLWNEGAWAALEREWPEYLAGLRDQGEDDTPPLVVNQLYRYKTPQGITIVARLLEVMPDDVVRLGCGPDLGEQFDLASKLSTLDPNLEELTVGRLYRHTKPNGEAITVELLEILPHNMARINAGTAVRGERVVDISTLSVIKFNPTLEPLWVSHVEKKQD
jgi:hypothetical protein